MLSRLFKYCALSAVLFGLFLAAGLVWLWLLAQQAPQHLERKGTLTAFEQTASLTLHNDEVRELRLRSDTGLLVDIAVRFPERRLEHRPLLVLMGGQETGRAAVEVIPDTRGAVVAAISYPFGTVPHRSMWGMFTALPRVQRGIFDTPAAVLLALDYLLSPEAGISPGRVELAGISFGAYLAAVPAALDARVDRLWLIHGGAAPAKVFDHGLRKRVSAKFLRSSLAVYLASVAGAHHLGPEAWVHQISPTPLVMVHALDDSAIPPEARAALWDAALPPFEVLWTPGDHVHPKRPEVILAITELLFQRVGCAELLLDACRP